MDAYAKGLDGKQAAWAARKYKGHRVIPESLIEDLDNAGLERPSLPIIKAFPTLGNVGVNSSCSST
jgi:hypothetical protein